MRYAYQNYIQDGNGRAVSGAIVTVYKADTTTLATIYAAKSGGSAISGSTVTTSLSGYFIFYIDNADYPATQLFDITPSKSGYSFDTISDVSIIPMEEGGFYYPDYLAADQGLTGGSNTIKHYVDLIGATNKATIYLRHNSGGANTDYVFGTDETIPSNITLNFEPGARLAIATGITVTINSSFNAGLNQVFSCTGTGKVVFGAGSVKEVYSEWWGLNATDNSTTFEKVIFALPENGKLKLNSGTYMGCLSVRKSNITIEGSGSANTILKNPDGGADPEIVLELGDTASGNGAIAYTNINVSGLTIDGNVSGTSDVTDDLHGWGMATTKISNSNFHDIKAINCWTGGVGTFINSNFNKWSDVEVYNCGFSSAEPKPGFDINSSKYSSFLGVISNSNKYGFRILDNCWNNIISVSIYNAEATGFVYNNQNVNFSYNNIINATVYGGCLDQAVLVGANCYSSNLTIALSDIDGAGVKEYQSGVSDYDSHSNTYNVASRNGQKCSCYIGGNNGIWNINSYEDGRGGAVGDYFAIDVNGDYNNIIANIVDSPIWQVRGLAIRAGATGNDIINLNYINTANPYTDAGTSTKINHGEGMGINIASNNIINIPFKGSVFNVTGTASIATITVGGTSNYGRTIRLIFMETASGAGVIDGSNLKLSGNFAYNVDDVLTLCCDGTNWFEMSRSVN